MESQWIESEVSKEQLPSLVEEIQMKILQNKAVELLPYCGMLSLKDTIWQGKVLCYKQTAADEADGDSSKEGKEMSTQSLFYLLEVDEKIIEETQQENAFTVDMDGCYALFEVCREKDKEGISKKNEKLIQSLLKYINKSVLPESNESEDENAMILFVGLRRDMSKDMQKCYLETFDLSVKSTAFLTALQDSTSMQFQSAPCKINGYEIKQMTPGETKFAVRHWKFSSAVYQCHFQRSCEIGLAFGAFPIGSDTPVGWAMISWDGAITGLQTLPGHRGKGIAKALIKNISSEVLKINLTPFAFIENLKTSVVPMSLFTSIGFEVFKDVSFEWVALKRSKKFDK